MIREKGNWRDNSDDVSLMLHSQEEKRAEYLVCDFIQTLFVGCNMCLSQRLIEIKM